MATYYIVQPLKVADKSATVVSSNPGQQVYFFSSEADANKYRDDWGLNTGDTVGVRAVTLDDTTLATIKACVKDKIPIPGRLDNEPMTIMPANTVKQGVLTAAMQLGATATLFGGAEVTVASSQYYKEKVANQAATVGEKAAGTASGIHAVLAYYLYSFFKAAHKTIGKAVGLNAGQDQPSTGKKTFGGKWH